MLKIVPPVAISAAASDYKHPILSSVVLGRQIFLPQRQLGLKRKISFMPLYYYRQYLLQHFQHWHTADMLTSVADIAVNIAHTLAVELSLLEQLWLFAEWLQQME